MFKTRKNLPTGAESSEPTIQDKNPAKTIAKPRDSYDFKDLPVPGPTPVLASALGQPDKEDSDNLRGYYDLSDLPMPGSEPVLAPVPALGQPDKEDSDELWDHYDFSDLPMPGSEPVLAPVPALRQPDKEDSDNLRGHYDLSDFLAATPKPVSMPEPALRQPVEIGSTTHRYAKDHGRSVFFADTHSIKREDGTIETVTTDFDKPQRPVPRKKTFKKHILQKVIALDDYEDSSDEDDYSNLYSGYDYR